jgi:hypothetical protein
MQDVGGKAAVKPEDLPLAGEPASAAHLLRFRMPFHEAAKASFGIRSASISRLAWLAALGAMSLYLTIAYASVGRPLWLDEFIHFALGSCSTTAEAWATIQRRLHDIYVGQTGGYQILDFWLLKSFGSSPLWLRMPSIVSNLFMAIATAVFFHVRGFKPHWAFLAIVALFCQADLMYYGGEARPYMPLAAASVGVLAYYNIPYEARGRWWPLGLIAIAWGCIMHAYFAIYWFALASLTYWQMQSFSVRDFRVTSFIRHCNPYLSTIGVMIFFALGAATWIRGGPYTHYDPFFYIPKNYLGSAWVSTQFQFIVGYGDDTNPAFALKCGAATCCAATLLLIFSPRWRSIRAPLALIGVALLLTGLVALISYYSRYWILSRQWIASDALCAIGLIWLAAEASNVIGKSSAKLEFAFTLILALLLASRFEQARDRIPADISFHQRIAPKLPNLGPGQLPKDNDGWVALANANVAHGGPVWPIFRKYLGN